MKKKIKRFIIALAISFVMALGIFALRSGNVGEVSPGDGVGGSYSLIICDVTFSVGVIYLCVGLLILVTNLGVFEMLSYGMASFFNLFRKKKDDGKFVDYLEYKETRKNSTLPWGFIVIIGICYIVVSLCFL